LFDLILKRLDALITTIAQFFRQRRTMSHDQVMALPFEFTDDLVGGLATDIPMEFAQ
jgi:hypothetical protein